jgi:hypothetical protein
MADLRILAAAPAREENLDGRLLNPCATVRSYVLVWRRESTLCVRAQRLTRLYPQAFARRTERCEQADD